MQCNFKFRLCSLCTTITTITTTTTTTICQKIIAKHDQKDSCVMYFELYNTHFECYWGSIQLYNAAQHNTMQHNTTQHNATQHSTTQCNTIQCNTMQYNTMLYNSLIKISGQVSAEMRSCTFLCLFMVFIWCIIFMRLSHVISSNSSSSKQCLRNISEYNLQPE